MLWLTRIILLPIHAYRLLISPFTASACRYHPSCSAYAAEAITTHGLLKGGTLTLRRLLRCHPWGASGIDPVPTPAKPLPTHPMLERNDHART